MKWVFFLLILSASLARAQGPDHEYIQIYSLIGQADTMRESGDTRMAAVRYRDAQMALQKLQAAYPNWNEGAVKFRLQDIAQKLQSLGQPASPEITLPTVPAITTPTSVQPAPSVDQVRQLQEEKALLEAKLKEALSVQPSVISPNELARVQEQMLSLQKERDLLKVALEQQKKPAPAQPSEADAVALRKLKQLEQERDELKMKLAAKTSTPAPVAVKSATADRSAEVQKLRARLEVLEARPTPFTPEELALFKQPPPQLQPLPSPTPAAVAEEKPVKKPRELPAGSGALVGQAERAFAARRFDEAEKKYLEVLRQDENNVYILGNLAATQMELSKPDEVEKTIQRALAADPDDGFTLTLLGMLKFRQDKTDEALDILSRAAQMDPQNPETQNYLGITLSQKGQRVAAEAALRKAIKIQPNYAGAHHNLAVVYATQTPPFIELARWHYDRAIALGHAKNANLEKIINGGK